MSLRSTSTSARSTIDISHSPPPLAKGATAVEGRAGYNPPFRSYSSAVTKPPLTSGYSPPSAMFATAAGRKPHVHKEMTAVSNKGVSKGKPLACASRPASSSLVYSPFENINMPQAPVAPRQAVSAAELSGLLQSVAAGGVLAGDKAGPQQELDEEHEVEALASPLKLSHEETLSEPSQASHTVCQASEVPAEPMSRELLAMTAFLSQMQAKQDEMNKFLVNKQEDMMDVLRYDVAKPLARLAERENSRSRSSSRASMASRGHVRNDDYTPLCYCPPPRFESKGKELVYSRTRELIGVLEARLRKETKLPGSQFTIVAGHRAPAFFKEAPREFQRRMRRQECLTRLDPDVLNLKGNKDVVSDAHSRYYYSDEPSETVYIDSLDNTSWDPSAMVHELKALDRYLKLEGVDDPSSHVVIDMTRRRWLLRQPIRVNAGGVPPHDRSPESEFQRNLTQLPKPAGAFSRQNSSSTTTMSGLPCTPRDSYQPREGGQNVSHRPSPSVSNPEPLGSIASSDANRPTVLSVASIFSQLTPDWEIEERTHLLLGKSCDLEKKWPDWGLNPRPPWTYTRCSN